MCSSRWYSTIQLGISSRARPESPVRLVGQQTVPLQDREIQAILQALESPDRHPKVRWQKDEVVRVNSGPFADFTGKIEEVNAQKEKLTSSYPFLAAIPR